jgi:hypothetical protein
MRKLVAVIALCALASGCADLKEDVRELRDLLRVLRGKDPAPPPPTPPVVVTPTPTPAAGLTLHGSCSGRDEGGYAETVRIEVARGTVAALDARIDIPNRGSCRYQLAEFRQTKQTPFVELLARSGSACAVRMWQQGDRVTVAATDCAEKCTRGAFEYAWPIELRSPGGGCY